MLYLAQYPYVNSMMIKKQSFFDGLSFPKLVPDLIGDLVSGIQGNLEIESKSVQNSKFDTTDYFKNLNKERGFYR